MQAAERLVLYALLTALSAISVDALLPGLRALSVDVGISAPWATQHVILAFILGMALGELTMGPISDAVGRKPALLAGLLIYSAGTMVAATSSSFEIVVLGRVLQGVGVAGPKIATRAMIRDQFKGEEMARIMSFMFSLFILVPMLAPALGQAIEAFMGWRAIFMMYLLVAIAAGGWLAFRQRETLSSERRIPLRFASLARNSGRILANRRVLLLIVATGFVFGAQLVYLSTAADLFSDAYGAGSNFPILFAVLAGGLGIASFTNGRFVRQFGMVRMARAGVAGLTAMGTLMIVSALIMDGRPPLATLLPMGFVAFFSIGILFGNLNAIAMEPLANLAGLGASLIASGSSLVATVFAAVISSWYDGTTGYLAAGFLTAGAFAWIILELAFRTSAEPVRSL